MRTPLIIIAVLIWAKSKYTHAQSYCYGPLFETSIFNVKSKEMDSYFSSFNLANQPNLAQEVNGFTPTGAFHWGFEITSIGMHLGVKFNRFNSAAEAKFNDGSSRSLELTQKSWLIPIGFSYYTDNDILNFNIGMNIGLGIQNTKLTSFKIYPDGTRSMGYDDYLNGIYLSNSAIAVPEITVGVGRVVYLYTSFAYQFSFWQSALKDENKFDMEAPGPYFGLGALNWFESEFRPSFGGYRVNFGVKINLFELVAILAD